MKSNTYFIAALISSVFIYTPLARSATILQDREQLIAQIASYSPVGQSFIAQEVTLSSIAFGFYEQNLSFPNSPITMTLYLGNGLGGTVLGSTTKTLSFSDAPGGPTSELIDFSFTGQNLVVGTTYTAAVTTSSPRVGVGYNSSGDAYIGGQAYESNPTSNFSGATPDLRFRVASVPEPSTFALLLSAAAGGWYLRRRNYLLSAK